jgi:hypothetical protein
MSSYGCASFASRPYRDAVRDTGAAPSAAADTAAQGAAPDAAGADELTLQEAADALGVHYMTAYRYVRSLVGAGLLDPVDGQGGYVLGPAVIEFDRTIRLSDPVLRAIFSTLRIRRSSRPAFSMILIALGCPEARWVPMTTLENAPVPFRAESWMS